LPQHLAVQNGLSNNVICTTQIADDGFYFRKFGHDTPDQLFVEEFTHTAAFISALDYFSKQGRNGKNSQAAIE